MSKATIAQRGRLYIKGLFFKSMAVALCLFSALQTHPAQAQSNRPGCTPSETKNITAKVTEIIDFQTVKTNKGHILRLLGLYIPSTLGTSSTAQTTKREAKHLKQVRQFLDSFLLGKTISYSTARSTNRYGFHTVTIFLPSFASDKNISLQEIMIRKGMAVFYALGHLVPCHKTLLFAEQQARETLSGLWSFNTGLVLNAIPVKTLNWKTQNFHIIEGKIIAVGQTRRTIYLNFEKNWRTDFTITLQRNDLPLLEKSGIKLNDLVGKTVRIRGWMTFRNGPMIPLQQPDNLEIMDEEHPQN